MRIGEELVQQGLVTQAQLDEALAVQKSEPDRKIGEILVSLGHLDIEAFTKVLEQQMGG